VDSRQLSKPHEDGPSYYPVVATISLGSHAVFHYYQYAQGSTAASEGQVIDSTPVHSIFLEPRSLIITASSLYTFNLHGIRGIEEDEFTLIEEGGNPLLADLRVPISNWNLVTANSKRKVIEGGGNLRRGVRYSLTCRDVEKVANPVVIGGR
jgi:alkylated DNA repair protein alkB family protein 6